MSTESHKSDEVRWFAARTGRCQELSVRKSLMQFGVECFIPTKEEFRLRRGHRVKAEAPLIPNLVFLRATKADACALANGHGLPLHYIIDRATRSMMVVPDKQMDDFIRVMDLDPDALCEDDVQFIPGGRVRVIKGDLAGVEGEVLSLPNRTYVFVSIGHLLRAKVQIPKSYLEIL